MGNVGISTDATNVPINMPSTSSKARSLYSSSPWSSFVAVAVVFSEDAVTACAASAAVVNAEGLALALKSLNQEVRKVEQKVKSKHEKGGSAQCVKFKRMSGSYLRAHVSMHDFVYSMSSYRPASVLC